MVLYNNGIECWSLMPFELEHGTTIWKFCREIAIIIITVGATVLIVFSSWCMACIDLNGKFPCIFDKDNDCAPIREDKFEEILDCWVVASNISRRWSSTMHEIIYSTFYFKKELEIGKYMVHKRNEYECTS